MDLALLGLVAVGLSLSMAIAWAIQQRSGQSGWIDTIWSVAVGLGGITLAIFSDGLLQRRGLACILIAAWAIRLGSHIAARTHGGGEDPRYAKLMEEWGSSAARQLFLFLQIQALAAFILVAAIYLAVVNPAPLFRIVDVIGLILAVIALAGEGIADHQLTRFRQTPDAKTGTCEVGLWRYSRHPNYFFEWLFWCTWPLLAITHLPLSWLSLLAPAMMYWLLVHVSGIPPLEDHMLRSRGAQFRSLQNRVNAFFPGPRRKGNLQ